MRSEATGLWQGRGAAEVDEAAVLRALKADATAKRILAKGLAPVAGDLVGVRLNLNILKAQGVCVHTLHAGGRSSGPMQGRGFWNGTVVDYRSVVTLRNAWFSVHQGGREAIASGRQAKHPMASIDGELQGRNDVTDGVEARFNPKVTHLFIDGDGFALRWAEEVTIVGHRAYARGQLVYHDEETAPARPTGCSASVARLRRAIEAEDVLSAEWQRADGLIR